MKYRNAAEVLPDALLKELQKYAAGEALYVPVEGKRKQWGAVSGTKAFYQQRNEEIFYKFYHGVSLEELSEEYCLSTETVRKILYQ